MRDFAKLDNLLRVFLVLAALALAGTAVQFAGFSFDNPIPVAYSDKDFGNYWTAGRLVLSDNSADLFGPQENYFRHMTEAFGMNYPWHNWSYPPHYLLFVWWTGYFSYGVALWLFMILTFVPGAYATKAFIGRTDLYVVAMMAPFVAHNFWATQNGFLTTALGLGALAFRSNRPVIAGFLLGMLTIKPQLGLLFPLLLLAERRWTVIASASITTLALFAASLAFYGVDAWKGYISDVLPYQSVIMQRLNGTILFMLTSVFGGLRNWGIPFSVAIGLHAALAVPVALATVFAFYVVRDDDHRAILLILGTFLITPYALTYDTGMVSAAAALLMIKGGSGDPSKDRRRIIATLGAILPMCLIGFGLLGLPVAPLILGALYAIAFRRSGAAASLLAILARTPPVRPSPAAVSD